jgi:8-oxo-dGTP pyrophosphatase MutT (NUDIX family)
VRTPGSAPTAPLHLDPLIALLQRYVPPVIPALPGRRNHLRGGVLVPLLDDGRPSCLMTVRALHLRQHAGEVCFPGGRPEDADADLAATALRETAEELGLRCPPPVGRLAEMPLYTSDWRICPFVSVLAEARWTPDPAEVHAVLQVDLGALLRLPATEGVRWPLPPGYPVDHIFSPIFAVPDETGVERLIYGGTAHALYELLQLLARAHRRPMPPERPRGWAWTPTGPVRTEPPPL